MTKNQESFTLPCIQLSTGSYIHESDEEYFFAAWCKELLEAGILLEAYRPEPIELNAPYNFNYQLQLTKKNVIKQFPLVKKSSYKPDMFLHFNPDWEGIFYVNDTSICKENPSPRGKYCKTNFLFYTVDNKCIIDVKGTFQRSNHIPFSRTQQLCAMVNIYVQKVVPLGSKGVFKKSFAPEEYLYTRIKKQRRRGLKSLSEFLKSNGKTKITIN